MRKFRTRILRRRIKNAVKMVVGQSAISVSRVIWAKATDAIRGPRRPTVFYIDAFSHCNLRCPSCTVGQADEKALARGLMTEDRLRRILKKATRECRVTSVDFYNRTEPLLHPNISSLIRVVRSFGINCVISTNLNVLRNADSLVAADPTWVRISLSGFTQEIYERGHRNGHIERVKENMRMLAAARDRAIADGMEPRHYEVYYHKYIDNAPDEALMREYALSLGYRFESVWAVLMPLEKMLALAERNLTSTTLTPEDRKLIGRLAVPIEKIVKSETRQSITSCTVLEDTVSLDVNGDAWLCGVCSGERTNMIGNYLEVSLAELQERRRQHTLCQPCMSLGLGPAMVDQENDAEMRRYLGAATAARAAYLPNGSLNEHLAPSS